MSRRDQDRRKNQGSSAWPILAGVVAGAALVFGTAMAVNAEKEREEEEDREDDAKPKVVSEVKCPVCYENYDDRRYAPMAFDCGHTACAKCATRVDRCPECRSHIKNRLRIFLNK